MRNNGQRKSSHSEQKQRTLRSFPMSVGRGIFRIPRGKGGLILLALVIVASFYQSNISDFFAKKVASTGLTETQVSSPAGIISPDNEAAEFTTTLIATLEETWQTLFQAQGLSYQPPKITLYREPVASACYHDKLAIGTFYCPQDNTVYVSLTLYDDMRKVFGAGGDFTQGYVIAHAFGHHVQQQLNPETRVTVSPEHELQADCFAGLWGNRMAEQQILSAGDLQQALNVTQVISKEQNPLQQNTILPEAFTYGSLEQRYQWFNRGFISGELEQCLNFDSTAI